MEEAIQKKVEESLNAEEIKLEVQRRLEEGRKRLLVEVAAQLEKEKEATLVEAKQKEASTIKNSLHRLLSFMYYMKFNTHASNHDSMTPF